MNIGILTDQNGYKRGASDFYPVIKRRKELSKNGIDVIYYDSHLNKRLFNCDTVIIDHRYYRRLIVLEKQYPDKRFIIELIQNLRKKSIKVILFDNGDGGGSGHWDMIEHVDLFVKKQLLKNREKYTEKRGEFSMRPFLNDYELSDETIRELDKVTKSYAPCPKSELYKIRLGWNIGMIDYRRFPLSRFYPFGTNRLLNAVYKIPKFKTHLSDKAFNSAFRGQIKPHMEEYAFQRNQVVKLFQRSKYPNLVTGDFISKNKYLDEMRNSKTCVSPFGWGEVCYRDFEAVINGCVLIKPDMDHLETWPDIYLKDETYVPLKWDMSDLEEKLNGVIDHYESYKEMVWKAQEIYKNAISDPLPFVKRFKEIVE